MRSGLTSNGADAPAVRAIQSPRRAAHSETLGSQTIDAQTPKSIETVFSQTDEARDEMQLGRGLLDRLQAASPGVVSASDDRGDATIPKAWARAVRNQRLRLVHVQPRLV